MDVKVFKTFLEVAKTRHFGKASNNLFITQAAVSARIKQLEEFIGSPLFERARNNIQLTPAGTRLIPYAETMVRALKQAKSGATLAENQRTQVSVAASPNVWDAHLQNYLTVMTEHFPKLAFRTEIASISQLNSHVIDGTVDLILLFDPFLAEEVHSENVANIELILVSTVPGQTLSQALGEKYVYVDWGTQFAHEHQAKYGELMPILHTSTGRIALDFLLAKGGAAYLPDLMIQPFLETGQLHKVAGQARMSRSIFATYHKDNDCIDIIKRIIKAIDRSILSCRLFWSRQGHQCKYLSFLRIIYDKNL